MKVTKMTTTKKMQTKVALISGHFGGQGPLVRDGTNKSSVGKKMATGIFTHDS